MRQFRHVTKHLSPGQTAQHEGEAADDAPANRHAHFLELAVGGGGKPPGLMENRGHQGINTRCRSGTNLPHIHEVSSPDMPRTTLVTVRRSIGCRVKG
jgi:hypothetical protein